MNLLCQAAAGTVAQAARSLLLSCDCPAAIGTVAGLQRRYDDVPWYGWTGTTTRSPALSGGQH